MDSSLRIELSEPDSSAERVDELTEALRRELLDLDVIDVTRPSLGPAPDGSRALDMLAIGALVVQFQASRDALSGVLNATRDWLRRAGEPKRTLRIQLGENVIELSGHRKEVEDQLVAEFLRASATSGGTPDGG